MGHTEIALEMFGWAQSLRHDSGHYHTGIVYPQEVHFPGDERSTYTAAAVILAADALWGDGPASHLFTDTSQLPELIDVECDHQCESVDSSAVPTAGD